MIMYLLQIRGLTINMYLAYRVLIGEQYVSEETDDDIK
jgi:hypothetical protein